MIHLLESATCGPLFSYLPRAVPSRAWARAHQAHFVKSLIRAGVAQISEVAPRIFGFFVINKEGRVRPTRDNKKVMERRGRRFGGWEANLWKSHGIAYQILLPWDRMWPRQHTIPCVISLSFSLSWWPFAWRHRIWSPDFVGPASSTTHSSTSPAACSSRSLLFFLFLLWLVIHYLLLKA